MGTNKVFFRVFTEAKNRPPKKDTSTESHDDILTAAPRYEVCMAEIQLRQQELQVQEMKIAAELQKAQLEAEERHQKEKHQIMMRLMTFVGECGEGDAELNGYDNRLL